MYPSGACARGEIDAHGWTVLRDDRHLIFAQNLVPVIRQESLSPTIGSALNAVSARLDTVTLRQLNRRVDVDERDPARVAAQWVGRQHGLSSGDRGAAAAGTDR